MERALEKVVSKVWAAQAGARGLGGDGRGHPRHKSPVRACTARVSSRGTASLTPLEVPQVSQHFRGAGGEPISAWPSEGGNKQPQRCPGPMWPGDQARARELGAWPPHPLVSPSRQRGRAGHLETKTS